MAANRSSRPTRQRPRLDDLTYVHPNAAGLDIGSEEIVVAVPADRDPEPVRVFRTFTPALHLLVAWLVACGIDTVAMESRGEKQAPLPELPPAKPGSKSKNEPNFNVRAQLARIVGVDLVAVMGLSASSVQTIISEIGTDMPVPVTAPESPPTGHT